MTTTATKPKITFEHPTAPECERRGCKNKVGFSNYSWNTYCSNECRKAERGKYQDVTKATPLKYKNLTFEVGPVNR